jgi:hypothetical protein
MNNLGGSVFKCPFDNQRVDFVKTNEQLIQEITALMADVWLAACERRVIAPSLDGVSFVVLDSRVKLFGPASGDECRLFIHRMAALDVLRALGTERVADAALRVANGSKEPVLNG